MARSVALGTRSFAALALCVVFTSFAARAETPCETAKIFANDPVAGDLFGRAAAVSGDLMVIGAPRSSAAVAQGGAAHVFRRVAGEWVEEDVLLPSDPAPFAEFGGAVAIDSRAGEGRLVVGAKSHGVPGDSRGKVYVFDRVAGEWTETARFTGSATHDGCEFGSSLATSGDTAVVGAPALGGTGVFYVFEFAGSAWTEVASFSNGSLHDHEFGAALAIDGDWIVAGDEPESAVVFYRRLSGVWTRAQSIAVRGGGENLGSALAIDGLTVLAGSDGSYFAQAGQAFVFRFDGIAWAESQRFAASDSGAAADGFGGAVALRDGGAVVGAPRAAGAAPGEGAAYAFMESGGAFVEIARIRPSTAAPLTRGFGISVGVSNDAAIVGAEFDDEASTSAGAAFAFLRGEVLDGSVDVGDGGSGPVDVLALNGSTGDPCRTVEVDAGVPATLAVERAPASARGAYAIWILDGDITAGVPIFRKRGARTFKMGTGAACLPITNSVAPGLCPCPSVAFPVGFTSKGLGAGAAARFCLNPAPGFPRAPASFGVVFPAGDFLIGGVVEDLNSFHSPDYDVSVANWIRVVSR